MSRRGVGKYKKAWSWPADVEEFMKARAIGFTVHVCNGASQLGNLRIDKFTPADIKADMMFLPLKTGCADTVICDPPWGIAYHQRFRIVAELRRILRIGGVLLFNAPWIPRVPGLNVEEIWIREHYMWDVGVISKSVKVRESLFNDR